MPEAASFHIMVATYGGEDGADFRVASYLKDWVDMGSLAGVRLAQ